MKNWAAIVLLGVLAGCAVAPVVERPESRFNDQLFNAPSERISADDVFALNDQMKQFLNSDIVAELQTKGRQKGLFDALYSRGQLKLDYDSVMTRNAAQAFAARSGNCLSLALLTAAFAKELGLPVRYQIVYVDEAWSRSNGIAFLDEHVNVTLGAAETVGQTEKSDERDMTIDFLPPQKFNGLRTRVIGEGTIVAMYLNNRAAETIVRQHLDDAYWWARAAILKDPQFIPAQNTLGVIFQRHGDLKEAEHVFNGILRVEPDNAIAMSNLVMVLDRQGRSAEAVILGKALAKIRPYPPFYFFDLGVENMNMGNFKVARTMFAEEVKRDAYNDKFHFWLALAYAKLGDVRNAEKHLAIAVTTSTTINEQKLYAATLAKLKAAPVH